MIFEDDYLGCPYGGVENLRTRNNKLNAKVLERVNESQELAMMNGFARESNDYQIKKSLELRISDIESWRWVLEDLSKRLEEGIDALRYEYNALQVVLDRVQGEIESHSQEATRPGALHPHCDCIEDVIMQEYKFLRDEKKKFESMIPALNKEIQALERKKKRIDDDVIKKQKAISVEEAVNSNIDYDNRQISKKKKKKYSPICRWENRCATLKRVGLQALSDAILIRQQVRGARVGLSIAAQANASRVDSALRKRLHANTVKLEELGWQKEEVIIALPKKHSTMWQIVGVLFQQSFQQHPITADGRIHFIAIRDLETLNEELRATEQNVIETMDQESKIEAKLADRSLRPVGELIRDDVDRKLRDELGRLRHFIKHLRTNIDRINSLQKHLTDAITCFDSCAEDLINVISLDEERIHSRKDNEAANTSGSTRHTSTTDTSTTFIDSRPSTSNSNAILTVIQEVDEDDDDDDSYPIDD